MTTPQTTERSRETVEDRGSTRVGALAVHWRSFGRNPTLVTVRVENTCDRPRRLRLDTRLDGPVDPPHRHGVAEHGWDEDGLTRTVPGGETVAVGYACDAAPETPPVDVRDGPAEDTDSDPVEAALRSLGDASPPRAALPEDPVADVEPTATAPVASADGASERPPDADTPTPLSAAADTPTSRSPVDAGCPESGPEPGRDEPVADAETPSTAHGSDGDSGSPTPTPPSSTTTTPTTTNTTNTTNTMNTTNTTASVDGGDTSGPVGVPTADPPRAVSAWFDAVEARVATADRLSGDVRDATPVVASLGGRTGIETLAATLDDDAAALHEVATRAADLAERVAETTVPDVEGDW